MSVCIAFSDTQPSFFIILRHRGLLFIDEAMFKNDDII